MSLRRLNFMNWPISSKLTAIFLLAVLLPAVLIVVPFSAQRGNAMLREQNEVRLQTLGPAEVAQIRLALISLSTGIERLVLDPVDYDQLERYFYLVRWTSVSEDVRQELQQFITGKIKQYATQAPSLSRVRLYDIEGNLLLDALIDGDQVFIRDAEAEQDQTLANALIAAGEVGLRTTITSIYADSSGNPSLDIVYTLRPPWDPTGAASIVGQMVFTQNLLLADKDLLLPNLYALLRDFPQSEQTTRVFLLDDRGQVIMPDADHGLLSDGGRSAGFRRAQSGETRVSSYHSPLLQTDVIGFHTAVAFPDGPRFTFLVETPLDEINRESIEEGFIALLWVGMGTLVLGLISIALGTLLIARPIARLTEATRQIAGGSNIQLPRFTRRDEISVLSQSFGEMADQLLSAIHELEDRVAERTHNLEAMLEVSRVLATIRDLDTLLEEVVNLIRDQFAPVYHAQVFLIDAQTNRAVLRASTGQ
ncbi:MAG: HAMP domain-containing protein, partial [Chloroflexi bacterium]